MSVSATLTWKGLDIKGITAQLEANQLAGLARIVPVLQNTLLTTIGTQYFSLSQLRRMGYPYSPERKAPMPPGVVNRQSGRFYESVRVVGPTKIGSLIVIQVYSVDEDRAWQLAGTEHEIPRPYKALLQARLRQRTARQVAELTASMFKIKVAA